MRRNPDKLGTHGSQKCGIITSLIMVIKQERDISQKSGSTARKPIGTTPNYTQSLTSVRPRKKTSIVKEIKQVAPSLRN
jgi:uncharacterized membrane-anchored protein